MSRLLTPDAQWRGVTHRQWDKDTTIPNLKLIVEKGGDPAGERPASGAAKQAWMRAAMQAIDGQVPPPSNAQALKIWKGDTTSLKHPRRQASRPQAPQPQAPRPQPPLPPTPLTQRTGSSQSTPRIQRIEEWVIPSSLIVRNNINAPEHLTLGTAYDDYNDLGIVGIRLLFYSSMEAKKLVDPAKNPYGLVQSQDYLPNRAGKPYPLRGRGTVWDNNSCAFDCVLAAGRLLRIGSTTADYGSQDRQDWINTLEPSQQSFIAALEYDWDLSSRQTNVQKRHEFLKIQIPAYNAATQLNLAFGRLASAVHMWKVCTSMTSQFNIRYASARRCKACQARLPDLQPGIANGGNGLEIRATREDAEKRLNMQQLLRDHFRPVPTGPFNHSSSCQVDAVVKYPEVIGDLPFHLVIYANPNYQNVTAATVDNISFDYYSRPTHKQPSVFQPDQELRRATYRWIGGIYLSRGHYRLYWVDDGANPKRHLKIYDGLNAMGAIIGGVPPDHPVDRVVDHWADGTAILFYEQLEIRGSKRKADDDDGVSGPEKPGKEPKDKDDDNGPEPPTTPPNKTERPSKKPKYTVIGAPTPPETPQNMNPRPSKTSGRSVEVVDLTADNSLSNRAPATKNTSKTPAINWGKNRYELDLQPLETEDHEDDWELEV